MLQALPRNADPRIDLQSIVGTFAGTATVSLITSEDVTNQPHTYETRDTYAPKSEQVPASGSTFHYVFPAHSFTQIVVGVNRPREGLIRNCPLPRGNRPVRRSPIARGLKCPTAPNR
jgi:hypothetical protein